MTDSYPVQLLKIRVKKYSALSRKAKQAGRYAAAYDYARIAKNANDAIKKITDEEKK